MINSAAGSLDHAEEPAEKTLKKGYPDGEGGGFIQFSGIDGLRENWQ